MTTTRLITAAIIGLMVTSSALACGDSLYRVGKGVSYRSYSAPLPGNLLILGNSDGARQLAEELARSGHEVQVVDNAEEMATELARGNFDVVIAPYSEHRLVESMTTQPSYLPVAHAGDEEKLAKQAYKAVMVPEKHDIKHYLKAIHQALKDNA